MYNCTGQMGHGPWICLAHKKGVHICAIIIAPGDFYNYYIVCMIWWVYYNSLCIKNGDCFILFYYYNVYQKLPGDSTSMDKNKAPTMEKGEKNVPRNNFVDDDNDITLRGNNETRNRVRINLFSTSLHHVCVCEWCDAL